MNGGNQEVSSPEYNELHNINKSGLDYEDSITKNNSLKEKESVANNSESIKSQNTIKSNKTISALDDIIDTNRSESFRNAHDSEYEGVFSNINDKYRDNINSEKKEKKKRKDEYFSKYNNI